MMRERGGKLFSLLALSSAAVLAAGGATADRGAGGMSDEDKIEYRKAVYKVIGVNFKPMGAMVKGKIDYDPELFARNAQRVADVSEMALEGFRGGPHQGNTESLDAIWEEWADYRQGTERFQEQAQELASAAQGGAEWPQLKKQFIQVADTCKSCHDDYRED
ncbi:c-type cytochrome [Halorhodospira neutriphila]|uniref:Cytochrome c n=1 Tax=Halorhodospira neutriphila TaxID=168379 RepID=A0ABS1E432_9GAMM|nr:cytochrome c [Halorhodospira neutriphila]MBK1725892.1 hypothetical protein [Halorhodospira neutriphila]